MAALTQGLREVHISMLPIHSSHVASASMIVQNRALHRSLAPVSTNCQVQSVYCPQSCSSASKEYRPPAKLQLSQQGAFGCAAAIM
eukprot:1161663-Rhodomonas_salina.1